MITIFSKPPYSVLDKRNGAPYIKRISSIIRAEQIASHMGAKHNPKSDYDNDICIHIKPIILNKVKDGDYVDVLDNPVIAKRIATRPGVNLIAMTIAHKEWLESFLPNKVVHIPHHHMNFERKIRNRREVLTCGYIGTYVGRHERLCKALEVNLARHGIKFITLFTYPTREDITKFYQNIDVQIIPMFNYLTEIPYYHEKKIVDAMSFGIPTISEERLGYRDVDDFYIKVRSSGEILAKINDLKRGWDIDKLINRAEDYHISNIIKKYQQL